MTTMITKNTQKTHAAAGPPAAPSPDSTDVP